MSDSDIQNGSTTTAEASSLSSVLLPDKVYNILKWTVVILLPAFGTLYFTLAKIWGLPHGEDIVGTISAFTLFLGVLIGISNKQYSGDGSLQIMSSSGSPRLVIDSDLETLSGKKSITLNVDTTDHTQTATESGTTTSGS